MLPLFKQLQRRRQIRKNKFLPVIAYARKSSHEAAWLGYPYYRLGMYQSAAAITYKGRNWKNWLAYIVSLAACGQRKKAHRIILKLMKTRLFGRKQKIALADSLAPFAPTSALMVLEQVDKKPPALHAALLFRLNRKAEAQAIVVPALHSHWLKQKPELYLLAANTTDCSPQKQLNYANQFIESYGLEPVCLKEAEKPFAAGNLSCSPAEKITTGPLVSILVTAFRSAGRIGYALDSLLQQTYRNIEIIVINDASDDNTEEIIQAIAANDARVRSIRLPANIGTFAAKNFGLRLSQGEFVTCHDSDDWAHPRKIEYQLQPLLQNPDLIYTTSQWLRVQDNGEYYARPVHPLMRLNPASPLFRKDKVLATMGAWDWVRTGADSEFSERLKQVFGTKTTVQIKKPLTFGAHRPDSLMPAPDTGYDAHGISETRQTYWEAWRTWHIECFIHGKVPVIDSDGLQPRPFAVPEKLMISPKNLQLCQNYISSLK